MDYFGRGSWTQQVKKCTLFQSFWVNGLLWKPFAATINQPIDNGFNPSGSMDYFGSVTIECYDVLKVSFNPSGSMDYFGRVIIFGG